MSVRRIVRTALLVAAAVALQLWVIVDLARKGLVDELIPWDECGYIFIAIQNIVAIRSGRIADVEFVHGPLSILPATAAMLVSNASLYAPYVLNGAYLIALFLWTAHLYRKQGALATAAALLVVVSIPYLFVFTSHVKTDFLGGVLMLMLAMHLFLSDEDSLRLTPRGVAPPAILAVGVVYSKPMAFYLPGLLGVLLLASAIHRWRDAAPERRREIVRFHAMVLAVAVVAYLALVLPRLGFFAEYIKQALGSRWSTHATLRDKALFYVPYSPARFSSTPGGIGFGFWGSNHVAVLVVIAGFVAALARSRARRRIVIGLAALLAAAAAAFVPIVAASQIQFSFGSFFAGLFVALVVYAHFHAQSEPKLRLPLNLAVVALSVAHLGLVTRGLQPWIPSDRANMRRARDVVQSFVAAMDPAVAGDEHPSIYFTFTSPIPRFDFGIEYYRRFRSLPSAMFEAYTRDDAVVRSGLREYDFVVMYTADKLPRIVPANVEQERYQQDIFAAANLREVRRMPYDGAEFILYRVVGPES